MKYAYLSANGADPSCSMWIDDRDRHGSFAFNSAYQGWQSPQWEPIIITAPVSVLLDLFHVEALDRAPFALYEFGFESQSESSIDGVWILRHVVQPSVPSTAERLLERVKDGDGIVEAVQYLLEQLNTQSRRRR